MAEIVLFVCYGNVARSKIAEEHLKKMISEHNLKIEVLSAGLNAQRLRPAKETIDVLEKEHINISNGISIQLTRGLLEEANLILTMEKCYKDAILTYYPRFRNKIFTLKEFAGETRDLDIEDPYGKGVEAYEKCVREIKLNLARTFKKLIDFTGA